MSSFSRGFRGRPREQSDRLPPGEYARRVDFAMLREVAFAAAERPRAFVCGPTPFMEAAVEILVALGNEPALVKTERYGPTGKSG